MKIEKTGNPFLVTGYGAPKISFDTQTGLQEIFNYLKNSGKRCYIAIDEFQQITEYPEKGVEALLRSHIQFSENVKFIFSGSKKQSTPPPTPLHKGGAKEIP